MTKHILFLSFFLLPFLGGVAQDNANEYFFYIQFNNKNGTPYSLNQPTHFLSQRAIERRAFFAIPIDSLDLPVSPAYLSEIRKVGAGIHATSKWLNGATIRLSDTTAIAKIRKMSFVKFAQYTGIPYHYDNRQTVSKTISQDRQEYPTQQIQQLKGEILHQEGFLGENIHIAVIDAGFKRVNTNRCFQTLREEGRLLGTKDFVNPHSNIYAEHHHGATVLSVMGGEIAATYRGSAPKASYWLLRTEEARNEYLYEPDLWISAIEYADSVGVDISTSSLGYSNHFDDTDMNYKYSDLDGKTIRASIAAQIATQKGMLVLCAAGNDGDKSWKKISIPSDAKDVICVGAVDSEGFIADFSSYGANTEKRIKPEMCAMGVATEIINPYGHIGRANGTSFSTPLMAGMMACYLQAAKKMKQAFKLDELKEYVFQSANKYQSPTTKYGYGIPNFEIAYKTLLTKNTIDTKHSKSPTVYYNKKANILSIQTNDTRLIANCQLYDIVGNSIYDNKQVKKSQLDILTNNIQTGSYLLRYVINNQVYCTKIVL